MDRTAHLSQTDPMISFAWILLPAAAIGLYMLAKQYFASKRRAREVERHQTTLRLLDQLILRDPTNAMAFWQKGEVYEALGMHDRALRFYKVAHEMCPRAYAYHDLSDAFDRVKTRLKFPTATSA